MLYHVSSNLSIQLFDTLSVSKVVNSQNTPSVYFCVYVYGCTPSGPRTMQNKPGTKGEQTKNIRIKITVSLSVPYKYNYS